MTVTFNLMGVLLVPLSQDFYWRGVCPSYAYLLRCDLRSTLCFSLVARLVSEVVLRRAGSSSACTSYSSGAAAFPEPSICSPISAPMPDG